jgi:hypothetical protein
MPYASINTIIMIFRRYFIMVISKLSMMICCTFLSSQKNTVDHPTSIQLYQNSKIPCIYMPYASINIIIMIFRRYFILVTSKLSENFLGFYVSPTTKSSTHHPTNTQMYQNSKMPCLYMPYTSINTIIMIFRRYFILVTSKLSVLVCRFFFSTKKTQ